MIVKILPSRRTFAAIVHYNEKNASEFLGVENFPSVDKTDLIRYFETFGMYSNVKDQVFHCSIALPPGEEVSDATFKAIAGDYMRMMGYGDQPYAMYRHYDKGHHHLHLVSSRINFQTLKKINDSNERYRSQKAADVIEKKYNLIQVERSHGKKMARLPEGVVHRINEKVSMAMSRKPADIEELQEIIGQEWKILKTSGGIIFFHIHDFGRGKGIGSSKLPVFRDKSLTRQLFENKMEKIKNITDWKAGKRKVEDVLTGVIKKVVSIQEFQMEMSKEGIQTVLHSNSGGIYGISFTLSGITYKGSEIGKKYSWVTLNRFFDSMGQSKDRKPGKAVKTTSKATKTNLGNTGKAAPSLKLGRVSTAEDEWKRRKRRKEKEEEEAEEKKMKN